MQLTTEWDKTFPQSEQVNHSKVTFKNRYGIIGELSSKQTHNIMKNLLITLIALMVAVGAMAQN